MGLVREDYKNDLIMSLLKSLTILMILIPILQKRKITIDLTIIPDEYREDILIDYQVKSKLVPREALTSKIIIGQDGKGKPLANELKSGQRGQMYFDPDDSELKDDKGTPVEEIEETDKIKNLKQTRSEILCQNI